MGFIDVAKGVLCLLIALAFILAFFSSRNMWAILIGVWFLIFGVAFIVQNYRNKN